MTRGRPPRADAPLTVSLAPDIKIALNEAAKAERVSLSDFVAGLLAGVGVSKTEFIEAYRQRAA